MSEESDREASSIGWKPKESFPGDPARWVDSETFLEKGKEVMPLLKATNKRLETQIGGLQTQLTEQTQQLKASQEAIEALKQFNSTVNRDNAKKAKKELIGSIKEARTNGDVEAELELQDQLDEVTETLKESEETAPAKPNGAQPPAEKGPPMDPEWVSRNSWWGTDEVRTAAAVAVAKRIRSDSSNSHIIGRAFLDKVADELEKIMPSSTPASRQESRVESSRGGASGSESSGGKRFVDLPSDAKADCDKFAAKLVGEGRAYKTMDEWRKAYTQKYYEQEN